MTLGALLALVLVLVILGIVGYAVRAVIPMDPTVQRIALGVIVLTAILVVVLFLFAMLGVHVGTGTRLW